MAMASERKTDPRARVCALLDELQTEFEKLYEEHQDAGLVARLQNEVECLMAQLADRKDIERAKDLLAASLKISGDESMRAMQKQASSHNVKLVEIARGILLGLETAQAAGKRGK